MDIFKSVQEKISLLDSDIVPIGLKAVLAHIEIAEKYFFRAKKERDPHLFTDVIYRTNHAFEGILKEAFSVFQDEDPNNRTPYEIEDFLTRNSVLRERVMELFTNYRKNWRNPSTHDYQLFFSEQEAFLAIVTVTAFVSILSDQMVETIVRKAEKQRFKNKAKDILASISNYDELPVIEKVSSLLMQFSQEILPNVNRIMERPDAQILGMVAGFLESVAPDIQIIIEPEKLSKEETIKPDLIFLLDKQKIAVDLRKERIRPDYEEETRKHIISQMKQYLYRNKINQGIIYYFPLLPTDTIVVEHTSGSFQKNKINIRSVFSGHYGNQYTQESSEHTTQS